MPAWLCILRGRQFEGTFENAHWQKSTITCGLLYSLKQKRLRTTTNVIVFLKRYFQDKNLASKLFHYITFYPRLDSPAKEVFLWTSDTLGRIKTFPRHSELRFLRHKILMHAAFSRNSFIALHFIPRLDSRAKELWHSSRDGRLTLSGIRHN